ncbi:MAG TPA: alpha/beta hydrolase [Pyrinomonadaceae bacterium]|nr:alpha/beta hydrolase [Pyrinomonadaceae bacterium]
MKNSPTFRLPIIILKSDNPQPQPDPILRTFGGPGSSSLRMVNSRRFSPWLKDRNVIIFEQRGTRYAQPALECPEVNASNINSAKQNLDAKTARANELQAAKACHERLTKQGINLSAYNSAESAADIEDLRHVLKLDKINLHGVSYSARLMLNVMRDYPQGIRSVVLESTLPPQVNYDEVGVEAIVRSLNVLFRNCKLDARCAAAYPKLEEEFYASVSRLNKQPISASVKDSKTGDASVVKLNGNDFATWLIDYLLSNDAEAIADAPLVIHQTFQGKYAAFEKYANEKTSPSTSALGMRYSVWCGEEIPFESRRKIAAQSFRYSQLEGYEVMALPDICSVWKIRAAKPVENRAVKSDIPTLVLTAEYDAYTPPAWGTLAKQTLKNSFLFEVPWVGHGPAFSSPCAREMIAEFFARPTVAPKSDCLKQEKQKYNFVVNK